MSKDESIVMVNPQACTSYHKKIEEKELNKFNQTQNSTFKHIKQQDKTSSIENKKKWQHKVVVLKCSVLQRMADYKSPTTNNISGVYGVYNIKSKWKTKRNIRSLDLFCI